MFRPLRSLSYYQGHSTRCTARNSACAFEDPVRLVYENEWLGTLERLGLPGPRQYSISAVVVASLLLQDANVISSSSQQCSLLIATRERNNVTTLNLVPPAECEDSRAGRSGPPRGGGLLRRPASAQGSLAAGPPHAALQRHVRSRLRGDLGAVAAPKPLLLPRGRARPAVGGGHPGGDGGAGDGQAGLPAANAPADAHRRIRPSH